jgi:predicted TIM-barrel fold metal-dependent hydrolase
MTTRYFIRTEQDKAFYQEYLQPRLPASIFDVHVHINLPEHIAMVPESRWLSDWALESGHLLPCQDAYACAKELYPNTEYRIAGFPWPIREANLVENNAYLAKLRREGCLAPFMAVRPEWPIEEIERTLVEGDFVGFKPYADMLTGVKGAEVSIFAFFPHKQWQLLNHHQKAVMLHLPRKDRFADDDNIRELCTARDRYPDVTIIIAHFGRAFCPIYLEQGLKKLGGADGFYFDTAAVINPDVYDLAFSRIPAEQILYGSDMPILFWHGRREWAERAYHNLCREDFSWNQERRSPEEEAGYTLFLYEQMRVILDAFDRHGLTEKDKMGIWGENAKNALKIERCVPGGSL